RSPKPFKWSSYKHLSVGVPLTRPLSALSEAQTLNYITFQSKLSMTLSHEAQQPEGHRRADGVWRQPARHLQQRHRLCGAPPNLQLRLSTEARRKACALLPDAFTYDEAEQLIVPAAMRSKSSFSDFFSLARRLELMVEGEAGKWHTP